MIAGDGERREEFEGAFEGCENVFFVGHVPFVVTRRLAELASGYFLFYREPSTFENHLTNKIREFAACPRPIIHNLSDNIFTVGDDTFQVGLTVEAHEFDDLCELIIKNNTSSFAIGDLGRLAQVFGGSGTWRVAFTCLGVLQFRAVSADYQQGI